MLNGAVKRLRTTNQLKEGMEQVIIDQCKASTALISRAEIYFSYHYFASLIDLRIESVVSHFVA